MPDRFRRHRLRQAWWVWVVLLLLALRVGFSLPTEPAPPAPTEGRYRVQRVVDGDTLLLESGTRVRLQGIDAPETVKPNHPVEPWGAEAAEFTKTFVANAQGVVHLRFGKERIDRYGRSLAFVWHNDLLLNEELVRSGLASARLGYRYSGTMKNRLQAAEQEAKLHARGIWSPSSR